MIPSNFQPFFTASVAASAALIGLLFVSVSIAPERVFGPSAEPVRQAQALSAFTALANIFFISMTSLIPEVAFGIAVTIIALPASVQTLALLGLIPHWRAAHILWRGLFLLAASATIYVYELVIGIQMWLGSATVGLMVSICFVIIAAYAIGLGRAWELLGAPRVGLVSSFWRLVIGAHGAKEHATKP